MNLDNTRILVTGNRGFMGTFLIDELEKRGINTAGFDKLDGNDITDWDQVKKINDIDVVIHLAAITNISFSYKNPRETYKINTFGTLNVLELCRLREAKIILPSTSYVYNSPKYLPIDEKHPLNPLSPYARSKLICERLCRGYHDNYGVQCIINRLFNVYGKGMSQETLIYQVINQILDGKRIIVRDFLPRRDYVYVKDVIDAFLKSTEYEKKGFEIFNIGYGKSYSVKEVVDNLIAISTKSIDAETLNKEESEGILDSAANIKKAGLELGWKPRIDLKQGLKEIYLNISKSRF
jgi:UDP-glucose 4-epimerase